MVLQDPEQDNGPIYHSPALYTYIFNLIFLILLFLTICSAFAANNVRIFTNQNKKTHRLCVVHFSP